MMDEGPLNEAQSVNAAKSSSRRIGRFVIEIMNGPEDGRIIECREFPITIGRASDNIVHLPYDHLISRHHATIEREGDSLTLTDLKSTNGTFFREHKVQGQVAIDLNKLLRVGATLLTVRLRSVKG
ncbi:MAG: FHA domain-containing protein [Candidatus Abyssobacteria bacterium SURF_5]|uniref:FHA domain-containing protein n=1 Tax=Abyssobacteria bacterium (strain SURF_5) TaxID=2093360 RepID=A0A3A4NV73_ABYX5|nr:MAG: FHA domain-containing protein [Candidatus Abyssubacteria bacterium SURF_5]